MTPFATEAPTQRVPSVLVVLIVVVGFLRLGPIGSPHPRWPEPNGYDTLAKAGQEIGVVEATLHVVAGRPLLYHHGALLQQGVQANVR